MLSTDWQTAPAILANYFAPLRHQRGNANRSPNEKRIIHGNFGSLANSNTKPTESSRIELPVQH
jgi:hypothetical protein